MEKIKSVIFGIVVGFIVGMVVMYRIKPEKTFFVTPKEVREGEARRHYLPEDALGCLKIIIMEDGRLDIESYN